MISVRKLVLRLFVAGILGLIGQGCTELLPSINSAGSYSGDNYSDIFEAFWTGMNNNYVYWSNDPTDWDSVYVKYKPLFAKLTVFNDANNATAEKYFTDMTAKLIDSHYTLQFQLTGHFVSPALNRKIAIDKIYPDSIYALPENFFDSLVAPRYLDPSSVIAGTDTIIEQNSPQPFTVITGTIHSTIRYLYFSSFAFSQAGANTAPVLNAFFQSLSSQSLKGVIIDVRDNGGGEVTALNYLIGKMISQPITYAYTHAKDGNGRLDYTPWAPAIVTPQAGSVPVSAPIVILADHTSISMSEITVLAVKALPNGKFIGTTTWGATGPLIPSVYLNGGQFTIGTATFGNNGYLFVYTSSAALKALNGAIYEGRGISPDIWVPETARDYSRGTDAQLERAIQYINSNL